MRLHELGEIVPCSYDFDTQTIGPLHVQLPIAHVCNYSPEGSWSENDLWASLCNNSDAIASIIVNNVFLVNIFWNQVHIYSRSEYWNTQVAAVKVCSTLYPEIPIGWVRTCPSVLDANVPPYKLYMDKSKRVLLNGKELLQLRDAVRCENMLLYKQLIQTDHRAVYMTHDGPRFL